MVTCYTWPNETAVCTLPTACAIIWNLGVTTTKLAFSLRMLSIYLMTTHSRFWASSGRQGEDGGSNYACFLYGLHYLLPREQGPPFTRQKAPACRGKDFQNIDLEKLPRCNHSRLEQFCLLNARPSSSFYRYRGYLATPFTQAQAF